MFDSRVTIVNQLTHLRLTGAQQLARVLAATVFPPRCCLCGFPGSSLELDLCAFCLADLPWLAARAPGSVVALEFAPPAADMIRRLKYHGVIAHARVLGVLLARAVKETDGPRPNLLVPVPLHDSRLRERGFNQAAALARYAGRMLGIPVLKYAARRMRDTPSQTSLNLAQRHRNVLGAFAVNGRRALRRLRTAGHVAVVDDVITTGSTVAELKSVLLAAGVARVDVWAVARVVQASPNFFSTSGGGPSNFASGTLPT
jgi:ComF family protein